MKYYIIAGEASGDLHGSNLIKEIHQLDDQADIRCWGGDLMEAAGAHLVKHYRDLAFMGFIEVIKNLPTILQNLRFCKQDILTFKPDAVVLIDYPGFNLRIAKWAKENGFKVIYYISPQVWAWKESRTKMIKKVVDKMLVILPFEKEFFARWDYKVDYVGHPLAHLIDRFDKTNYTFITQSQSSTEDPATRNITQDNRERIILLPGSRKQEILVKLPIMLGVTTHFPSYRFIIAQAPGQPFELYKDLIANYPNVEVAFPGQTYTLLANAKAALVTSGTATLETALFGVPQVVCYKGSPISYQIARRLLKIKYISLVNLIMDKQVVTELIQDALSVENLEKELDAILHNQERISRLKNDYAALKDLLMQGGDASQRAAIEIVEFVKASV